MAIALFAQGKPRDTLSFKHALLLHLISLARRIPTGPLLGIIKFK